MRENPLTAAHADWVDSFKGDLKDLTSDNVMDIVRNQVGETFVHVLEDAGVYKCTEEGREAFLRFINSL